MIVFYAVYFFILMAAFLNINSNTIKFDFVQYVLLFSCLVLIAGFRPVGLGSDDLAYMEIFSRISGNLNCDRIFCDYSYSSYNVEPFFYFILYLLSFFGSSSISLFLPISFLAVFLNLHVIRKFSPYIGASVLIYYTHFFFQKDMNAIRIGLASSLVFYAVYRYYFKSVLSSFLIFVLAAMIHVTSLVAIFPLIVYSYRPGRGFYFKFFMFLLILLSLFDPVVILEYVAKIFGLIDKYNLYVNAEMYNYKLSLFDVVNLKGLVVVFFCFLYWDGLRKQYKYFDIVFCFFYCATFFRIAFGSFAIVAGRGYSVIAMFEFILIPVLVFHIFGKHVGTVIVGVFSILILWLNLNLNNAWMGDVHNWI